MIANLFLTLAVAMFGWGLSGHAASAACSLPNQLANGQTADATQVMADLNALANCAGGSGTVTVTGAPSSGNLTIFAGPASITSGDLSGDCTTSGNLAVTCTRTSGTPFGPMATSTDLANLTGHFSSYAMFPQIGGNSYLGNTSSTTGNVTGYVIPDCHGAAQALQYTQAGALGMQCGSITAVTGGTNPFYIGTPAIKTGIGAPSASSDPVGSLYLRTDTAEIYQQYVASGQVPTLVQASTVVNSNTVTMSATPASGDLLVAFCSGYVGFNAVNTAGGWTSPGITHNAAVYDPNDQIGYKFAVAGESTSQTPCAGSGNRGAAIIEVSGVPNWTSFFEATQYLNNTDPTTYTTVAANALVLMAAYADTSGVDPGPKTITGLSGGASDAHYGDGSDGFGITTAGQSFSSPGSAVAAYVSAGTSIRRSTRLVVLKPGVAGWRKVGNIVTLKNAGTTITSAPISINFNTGLTATDDGLGNTTVVATGVGANPTATASDTAVNGSAVTFMRSDAAPAIQKGSSSAFGVVKVDNSTITASGGVISAVSGGGTVTVSGSTPVTNNCVKWATATAISDAGATCGSGGGGGTTNNYYAGDSQILFSGTLASAQSSISVSNIPGNYQDLRVVIVGRGDTSATNVVTSVRLNGDSGSNYDHQQLEQQNTSVSAAGQAASTSWPIGNFVAATGPSGASDFLDFTIFGYSGTTFQKVARSKWSIKQGSTVSTMLQREAINWYRNTSAVTSFTVTPSAGNFVAGTTYYVYGIGGANVTVNPQPGLPVISETVTNGSQSSVTVSSIPSTYRDLRIVVSGRGTTAATGVVLKMQVNGDTGSNYDYQYVDGSGTTALAGQSYAGAYIWAGDIAAGNSPANVAGVAEVTLYNYAGSTFQKNYQSISHQKWANSAGNAEILVFGGDWRNTAAITSLTVFPSVGNFQDGTVVTVYGIGGSVTATLPTVPPQGRLTLTSNTPVMTADATAQTTIYYAPYQGNLLPVGNVMYRFSQLSYALNTTAHASGSLYDIGAYNSSGTITLCTAPAWTNSTTRSAAIARDATNAIWTNSASLTCNLSGGATTTTIAAGQWTYLGTFYATAAGQTGMSFQPAAAAGGANPVLGIWNAYSRVKIVCLNRDSTASWAYSTATWRASDGSNSNRCSYVDGLGQSAVVGAFAQTNTGSASATIRAIGLNRDSTSATPQTSNEVVGSNTTGISLSDSWAPALGFHYVTAMEAAGGNGTGTWLGLQSAPSRQLHAMSIELEM